MYVRKLNKNKYDCSGCTACKNVCPTNAITMQVDKQGFSYPHVDDNLCINCNACIEICAFKKDYQVHDVLEDQQVYALKHKNDTIRQKSQSGGAFTAISDYVLRRDGAIYGVIIDKSLNIKHHRAINDEERNKMRGSKYVESNLSGIFKQIKTDLLSNRLTLFSGTPCQVAGLQSYINSLKLQRNLITVDLVCHGVPSQKVWHNYIEELESKNQAKINKVVFRDKERYGWKSSKPSFTLENGQTITDMIYSDLFFAHYISRPSCANCHYKNFKRVGDFTIGDFWGIEKSLSELDDNKGVSLLLCNTNKAQVVLKNILCEINYRSSHKQYCLQNNLYRNWHEPKDRSLFWREYGKKELSQLAKKYKKANNSVYPSKWIKIKHLTKLLLIKTGLYK